MKNNMINILQMGKILGIPYDKLLERYAISFIEKMEEEVEEEDELTQIEYPEDK